jgi:hypothetical protein
MEVTGSRVTLNVWAADRDWLQQRQRAISADRKSWITMAEMVHELIMAIVHAEEGA